MKTLRIVGLVGLVGLISGCATQMVNEEGDDWSRYGRIVDWAAPWHGSDAELVDVESEQSDEPPQDEQSPQVLDAAPVIVAQPVQWIARAENGKAAAVLPYEARSVEVWRDNWPVNGGIRDGDRWRFDLSGPMFAGMQLRVETEDGLAWYELGDGETRMLQ